MAYKVEEKQVGFDFHWLHSLATSGSGTWQTAAGAVAAGAAVEGDPVLPPFKDEVVECEARIVDVSAFLRTV